MTLLRTLILEYDIIEIHYNELLKNNPYLVRIFSYNNTDSRELRLNEEQVHNLYPILTQIWESENDNR
jgi:hypothetical protein